MTQVQKRIRALAILAGVIGGAVLLCGHSKKAEPQEWERYTVQSGDTLWSISKEYAPENSDIRNYIYLINERNSTGANLQPGQVIEIPSYE